MGYGRRPKVRQDTDRADHLKVLIGKDKGAFLKLESDEHVALLSRTGQGKTTGFTTPNCFWWEGSLVVLDIKGQAYEATAGYRQEVLGQRVFRFDPTAVDGRSHCWNPLDSIHRTSPQRFDSIMRQAFLLIPDPPESAGNAFFWQRAARMGLSAITMMLAEMPEERLTYSRVFELFMRADGGRWMLQRIWESRSGKRPRFSKNVVLAVSDYIGLGNRLTEDVRKSVSTNLQAWMNPQVEAATDHSDFDLLDFRRRPTSLYITVSPASVERLDHLLRLLFGSIINLNTYLTPQQDPRSCVPLLVILDEFVRLGAMPSLTKAAQFARGYGIRLAFVIQDKEQLIELYGRAGAADVFSNLGAEIVFGLADIHQAKEYSERIGNETTAFDTTSAQRFFKWFNIGRMGSSGHLTGRPLLFPWELVQLPEDKQVILRAGEYPHISERIRYYDEPDFMDMVSEPPLAPLLNVVVQPDDGTIGLPTIS